MTERWSAVAGKAWEVMADYEEKAGGGRSSTSVATIVGDMAERCFGLSVVPYPDLGEGVLAELRVDEGTICVRSDLSAELQAFVVAHEIGHRALNHPERIVDDRGHIDEGAGADQLVVQDGVYQAYNSRDLWEIEANVFAAELLAPVAGLREATGDAPAWTAEGLAARFGVSRTLVLNQLSNALLMGMGRDEGSAKTGPSAEDGPPLNADQQRAVTARTPALVIAGPGSGKTRVLAERYAYLVRTGVPEEAILALTFSNKAAEEMRLRVSAMLAGQEHRVRTFTFHGFCLELLKGHGQVLGLPKDFGLLVEQDARLLARRRLSELDLRHLEDLSNPGRHVPGVLGVVSRAKDELRDPVEFAAAAAAMLELAQDDDEWVEAEKAAEVARVYAAYQGWLAEGGYVDFGDLVRLGVALLEIPEVADVLREEYGHVLVDEFQDINFASGRLLRALDGGRGVLWGVADPDQSIYRFRGASAANLERFESDYPGAQTVFLPTNYRSEADIVGCTQGLRRFLPTGAAQQYASAPPTLVAHRASSGEPAVSLCLAPDAKSELARVASEIRERRDRGVPFAAQAVLCRTNSQARSTVEALKDAGIPAQGPADLRGSQEIKDALAVLSLLCETDGAGLVRVVDFPENCLVEKDLLTLLDWARREGTSPRAALERCPEIEDLRPEAVTCIQDLLRLLGDLRRWGSAWSVLLGYVFHPESRVRGLLADDSARVWERRAQLGQLAAMARGHGERADLVEADGLAGFLEYVKDMLSFEMGNVALPSPPSGDSVTVMTAHKSKGLEFPVVYVPHLAEGTEGRWPFSPPKDEVSLPASLIRDAEAYDDDEAEERRLFYVALTRAEDELVLSRAETYRKDLRSARPSRFIQDLVQTAGGRDLLWERTWDAEERVPSGNSPNARSNDEPSDEPHPLSRLRTYEACPQQYEYAHVYGLVEETSAYQRFYRCVYRTLAWMETEARDKGANPGLRASLQELGEAWKREGPVGHWYERTYRRRAETVVRHWQAAGRAPTWRVQAQLTVATPTGPVRVRADGVTRDGSGNLVVAQHRFDRPRKSHAKNLSDQLALYKAYADAEGRPVRVLIHYLCSDEEVEVFPGGKLVSNRVKKSAKLIEGVRRVEYPPNPGRACARCSWNLICPV